MCVDFLFKNSLAFKMSVISPEGSNNLMRNFETMAYNEDCTVDLSLVLKWLVYSRKCTLWSTINEKPYESATTTVNVKIDQQVIKIKLLSDLDDLISAYRCVQTNNKYVTLSFETRQDSIKKFNEVIRGRKTQLSQLEAFAGQIPISVIRKQDEPTWLMEHESAWISKLKTILESGNVFINLCLKSYCLRDIVALLLAIVQVDTPLTLFLGVKNSQEARLVLPILFLIDSLNMERIRHTSIDVLLLDEQLLQKEATMQILREAGINQKLLLGQLCSTAINAQVKNSPDSASDQITSSMMDLESLRCNFNHYIVDSSADVHSSASSIYRNVWLGGINVNHRCRQLLFAHQPVYNRFIEELRINLESMIIKDTTDNIPERCDFVKRDVSSYQSLHSVQSLGKIIASEDNFQVPTVVYDIGTASDLVASMEPGLGHILIVIPYRSNTELISLCNSYGDPANVFLYSNKINFITSIIKSVNGREFIVNGANAPVSIPVEKSWMVVSNTKGERARTSGKLVEGTINLKPANGMSKKQKIEGLEKLMSTLKDTSNNLPKLLSQYISVVSEGVICSQASSGGPTALIVVNAAALSTSKLSTALAACILRDRPVTIISVYSDFAPETKTSVTTCFPGVVTFIGLQTPDKLWRLVESFGLLWILQGSKEFISVGSILTSSSTKVLLINDANDEDLLQNAEVAISSAFKTCVM